MTPELVSAEDERQARRDALELEVDAAERMVGEAVKVWTTALLRMIRSSPSIGDALLGARDRAER